jgi:hypothetical protein
VNVRIDVHIDSQNQNGAGYGNIGFSETVQLTDAGFDSVAKIFTRCHELLETIKAQHDIARRK